MKKLYVVEVTYEVIVVADSYRAAEVDAQSELFRITSDCEPRVESLHEITKPHQPHMYDWPLDALPYGDHEDKTVEEWIDTIEAYPVPDVHTLPLDLDIPPQEKPHDD